MENILIFKKNGVNYLQEEIDGSVRQFIVKDIFKYLSSHVLFEENYTVYDFVNFLYDNKNYIERFFKSFTNDLKLKPFYDVMNSTPTAVNSDIKFVEFKWNIDLFNDWFDIHITLNGVDRESLPYSLSMEPLCNWAHLPIKVNTQFLIENYEIGRVYEEDRIKKDTILDRTKKMTLYDVISSFLDEITFWGYPENAKIIRDALEEKSINFPVYDYSVPLEKVQLDFKREEMKKALETEDYEEANELKKEIEFLIKKLKDDNWDFGED